MKKKYSIFLGVAIVAAGILAFNFLNGQGDPVAEITNEPIAVEIMASRVTLTSIPYMIEATGTLQAMEKIELFSEVQGVLQRTKTSFKIGNRFRKGQTLIAIESKEHEAQIKSSRSDLMNQLAAMLPDMEIDYPDLHQKWEVYLENLNVNSTTPPLPEFGSNEEKLFISGKNVYSTYFNIKNLEERLSKYYIGAPFSGIVTESNVNVGTLVRSGQKIGEFVDDSNFELRLSVPATDNKFLKKGMKVDLKTIDNVQSFQGTIIRINGKIDQDTQSIDIIVEVDHQDLRDGGYLKAQIKGNALANVFKLDNSLILENNKVYIVKDNVLVLHPVKIINYQGNMAVVSGLEDGMLIAGQRIANAYPGMQVKIKGQ